MQAEARDFDLLVFLARNWLPLLVVPLLVAVLAYLAAGRVPLTYTASIEVPIPTEAAASLNEPPVVATVRAEREGVTITVAEGAISVTSTAESAAEAESNVLTAFEQVSKPLVDEMTRRMEVAEERRRLLASGARTPASNNPEDVLAAANLLDALQTTEAHIRLLQFASEQLQAHPDLTLQERQGGSRITIAVLAAGTAFLLTCLILGAKAKLEESRRR